MKKINRALVSVYHKDGLDEILRLLVEGGVKLLSTGGTRKFIEGLGYECEAVEDVTGYPSIFGGRVKTLHPAVFGGILQRRDNEGDRAQAVEQRIEPIDLVIVDLYPFEQTVASGASAQDIIEKIDIGGISLIRAAAKNFNDVAIVASKGQYGMLLDILRRQGPETTLAERRVLAAEAFAVSSGYDTHIYNWFAGADPAALRVAVDHEMPLRYGENPHQAAVFYGDFTAMFDKLHGKEVSYNNIGDIDAGVRLLAEFTEPTFVILKHQNACGVATRPTIGQAWDAALACDPVSAFGGVLLANRPIDRDTAEKINSLFCEVLIAPDFSQEALDILFSKKNRIILRQKAALPAGRTLKTALNGILVQEADAPAAEELKWVTKASRDDRRADLEFANKIVKHSKSNAITLARDLTLLASGVGQTSRVDSLKHAIDKARGFGFTLDDAVMASDAFFPFADCVTLAAEAGVKTVVQPGGSVRDQESVDKCDETGVAMAMTGRRHFKH